MILRKQKQGYLLLYRAFQMSAHTQGIPLTIGELVTTFNHTYSRWSGRKIKIKNNP